LIRSPSLGDTALLLTAWEAAGAVPASAVGAVLLHHAGMVDDLDTCLDLPLVTVSALVARVYSESFGDTVEGVLTCGSCEEPLEVTLPLDAFSEMPDSPDRATVTFPPAGRAIVVRCPTTRDLLAVAAAADPAGALLDRCVTGADGDAFDPDTLDPESREAADAAAEDLAGAAAAVVRSTCPRCGDEVSADVDVTALLWQRVTDEVPAVLAEVVELASAYGWSEADIMAMSAPRRGAYLGLARSRL
jgi:hypothetical protein